jgi:hypothetical protein
VQAFNGPEKINLWRDTLTQTNPEPQENV